jgi:hypothetical protein
MTLFDKLQGNPIFKSLINGIRPPVKSSPIEGGQVFRVERGQPYYRAGKPVYAVPQFRSLNLFSPTAQNALLPTITITPSRIAYPVKVK